mmetsp:Transcript_8768/g.11972  ORF Transcript_8768/g.11972 Transcript_8768/m.11972 type:complete len:152 (-) Transcript_8768:173-628(-)
MQDHRQRQRKENDNDNNINRNGNHHQNVKALFESARMRSQITDDIEELNVNTAETRGGTKNRNAPRLKDMEDISNRFDEIVGQVAEFEEENVELVEELEGEGEEEEVEEEEEEEEVVACNCNCNTRCSLIVLSELSKDCNSCGSVTIRCNN